MIIILSPSKTIDQTTLSDISIHTTPVFLAESHKLVTQLKKFDTKQLSTLMSISSKLAEQTYDRYQFWKKEHNQSNSKQAILSFKGDVYTALDASSLSSEELVYAQEHLIILSGLYGVLKSMDLIQPYRLEIATKLTPKDDKDLYSFWRIKVTKELNKLLSQSDNQLLLNLASNEYSRSIDFKKMNCRIVTPMFKEFKNGDYKVVSIFAKRARGLMTRYIIRNRITNIEDIKLFLEDGYYFNNELSSENEWVFTRG